MNAGPIDRAILVPVWGGFRGRAGFPASAVAGPARRNAFKPTSRRRRPRSDKGGKLARGGMKALRAQSARGSSSGNAVLRSPERPRWDRDTEKR